MKSKQTPYIECSNKFKCLSKGTYGCTGILHDKRVCFVGQNGKNTKSKCKHISLGEIVCFERITKSQSATGDKHVNDSSKVVELTDETI